MPEDVLGELLGAYVRAGRKRAQGELWPLSGFDYQLRAFLADFVQALIDKDSSETADGNLLEALSDYASREGGNLILVQVKRTLTRATLRAAAVEFIAIDEFLNNEAPSLRPQVLFEVVGRTADTSLSWSDLEFSGELAGRNERIAALLHSGWLGRIRIEPDPWWRLLVTLNDVVDDPIAFANEALEIALQRGDREARVVSREILRAGHAWLADREDRPEWTHVWERLTELGQAS